jgi:hypothetical protein
MSFKKSTWKVAEVVEHFLASMMPCVQSPQKEIIMFSGESLYSHEVDKTFEFLEFLFYVDLPNRALSV